MKLHELQVVLEPLDQLRQHPDNPNNGDVDALEESIEVNGFYSPIVVQRSTRYILAGNHRYLAAMRLHAREIPTIWLDVDDDSARRIMLADNQITRRGHDDEAMLANMLQDVYATDLGLSGTGYDNRMMAKLLADLNEPVDFDANPLVDDRLDEQSTIPKGLRFSVTPQIDEDGVVYELAVVKVGMGALTRNDANAVRKALGLQPYGKDDLKAFGVDGWR